MPKQIVLIILAFVVGLLSGCQSQGSAEIAQLQQQLAGIETRLDELAKNNDLSDLQGQITALEEKINTFENIVTDSESLATRITALEASAPHNGMGSEEASGATTMQEESAGHVMPAANSSEPDQLFQVAIATYLMDTAGFHALDERLNEEGTIMPGDAGTVNRVQQVLAATDWPEGLEAKAGQLMDVLEKYAEALANDDIEAAKPLATEAHEVQHDFSEAIEKWRAGLSGQVEAGEMEHMHDQEGAHVDHSAHHGGFVGMSGDLHLEIVSEQAGEYQIYLSDAFRQPINPEGISGSLVLNPGSDQEETLPLQIMNGEYLAASGGPTGVDSMDVSIRLDGTPAGHVEMDFTLSYEADSEHHHEEQGTHEHGG